uniref:Uncharacterized protein n=1 Tax=Setaria italica TaxID=4555 RepID=K3Y4F7_SETIT
MSFGQPSSDGLSSTPVTKGISGTNPRSRRGWSVAGVTEKRTLR